MGERRTVLRAEPAAAAAKPIPAGTHRPIQAPGRTGHGATHPLVGDLAAAPPGHASDGQPPGERLPGERPRSEQPRADHPRRRPELRPDTPVVELSGGALAYGTRMLWSGLDLAINKGEFVAVLGANGTGKTSLLRVLLGEQALTAGTARIGGQPVRRGSDLVGYVPQRVGIDSTTMVKARDVVRMGLDGDRWGPSFLIGTRRRQVRTRVDELLASVGAAEFGEAPVSMLSGGELQRIRVAEALAADPALLICDEPLAALDLRHQRDVAALIDRRRREHGTAVIFVTHEINPVLQYVDQVLYLGNGRFQLGPPSAVMTSRSLSALYGAPVDVVSAHGRLVVVASNDPAAGLHQSVADHAPHDPDLHDHGAHDPHSTAGWVSGGAP